MAEEDAAHFLLTRCHVCYLGECAGRGAWLARENALSGVGDRSGDCCCVGRDRPGTWQNAACGLKVAEAGGGDSL